MREDRAVHDGVFDLAIVGSGFGGSLLAMIARRLGLRVMLIERGRHPRFAIGESASPLAGILIEQLADRYDLPRVRPLSAYGTWQRTYPDVVCGLKRGFTYFKHETGRSYQADEERTNQLLVAASPSDEVSDTHWLRSDVDHFLVNEAGMLGVEYHDLVELDGIEWQPSGDPLLKGTRQGQTFRVHAQFVVDASGPHGFLSKALGIANRGFAAYPRTQALFSHFTDVARCDEMQDYGPVSDAPRVPSPESRVPDPESRVPDPESRVAPPYPIDDAALHHVFDGGWMWVLRFGNGVTSAGVAVEDWLADDLKLAEGEPAWHRLLARYPSIAAQFAGARPIRSFTRMPRLAYRAAHAAGERWAMLPSSAAFIDPLFSTGIPLTLLGIERLARILEAGLEQAGLKARLYPASSGGSSDPPSYSHATLADADRTAQLVAGSYAGLRQFPLFASYSMFYFAAASYSEMARRLDSPRTPRGFLCGDSDRFAGAMVRLSPATARRASVDGYHSEVAAAIADWNVAGLCDPDKRNWYDVDLDDTIRGAEKLGLTRKQVRDRLGPVTCTF